jgi:two-component system, OmpR family, sensor histidine kinase TctE
MRFAIGPQDSLTYRLLRRLVVPMAVVAILLGVGGSWVITTSVQAVSDRILGAASRAIADSLVYEDGEIALNLSPAIFGMLEDAERDNVYYSVRSGGRLLTGYDDLPDIAPDGLRDTQVVFGRAVVHGKAVRVVAEGRRLPHLRNPVIVEVAETLDARQRVSHRMLGGLALLEAFLIAMTAVLLPLAVRRGLRPLTRVSEEMDARAGADLTPLPLAGVPRELRDLVRAFNGMLARLDTTLQNMRRFTADASHQMRTPLSILRTHIALVRRARPGSAEAESSLADIDHATERLQRLVTQLLALARADNVAPEDIARAPVDMERLVAEIATELVPHAVQAGMDLHFEAPNEPAIALTQAVLATEVISNFVDNAIRYNRDGGTITVAVHVADAQDEVIVSVVDDGPGIPAEDRERVFTRFTRLDRDSSRPGSGLGLPIAARLGRAIGARIELMTARSGQGLRVEIAFPRGGDA